MRKQNESDDFFIPTTSPVLASSRIEQMSEIDLSYLYEFEKCVLGYEPRDLTGQVFLKSPLMPLQKFLLQWNSNNHETQSLFLALPLSAWTHYAKFLIDQYSFERHDLHQAIQTVIDFNDWLKKTHLSDLNTTNIEMALKYGQKEVERGLTIQKHLKRFIKSTTTPPLQSYDLNSVEVELSLMQFQDIMEPTEPYYGEYELLSKDLNGNKVYFKSTQTDKSVILQLPDHIFDHLQKGDRFHFEYEETPEQHQRFKNIEFHFPDFELED